MVPKHKHHASGTRQQRPDASGEIVASKTALSQGRLHGKDEDVEGSGLVQIQTSFLGFVVMFLTSACSVLCLNKCSFVNNLSVVKEERSRYSGYRLSHRTSPPCTQKGTHEWRVSWKCMEQDTPYHKDAAPRRPAEIFREVNAQPSGHEGGRSLQPFRARCR